MNSLASVPGEAGSSWSDAQPRAAASWLPRHRAAFSRPASCQARGPGDAPAGQQVLQAALDPGPQPRPGGQLGIVGDLRGVRVHGDQPLGDEPGEHVLRFAAPGPRLAEPDRGAGRRGIIGDLDEPEEQPARQPLFGRGKAAVHALRGARERIGDSAAGQVVRDGQRATAAVLPGSKQGMRQQRQRAGLIGGWPARPLRRGQIVQQQPDQAFFHVNASQPGRLGDRAAHLLRRHRAEHDVPGLQRGRQLRIAQGMLIEVGAQRQDDQGGLGQLAYFRHELGPLALILALGEHCLELVHDDGRPAGVAGRLEFPELRPERGERRVRRFHQADRAGQPRKQARPQQRRLARPRRSDQDQRQRVLFVGQGGQQVRDIFTAEEPPCVLALEPGQPPVRSVGAGRPPAGRPLGPLQGTRPPGQHSGIGLAARAQDLN